MKRLGTIALIGLLTNALLAPSALAGVHYLQYNQEVRAEKAAATAGSGEKFMHQSKYQREQQGAGNTLPSQNNDINKPANKYDQWGSSK